jgi:hypothetical protein
VSFKSLIWSKDGFETNSEVDLKLDDPELASEILQQMKQDCEKAMPSILVIWK